jgi:hypothetical protein
VPSEPGVFTFSTPAHPFGVVAPISSATQSVQWKFDGFTCVWEHRTYAGAASEKHRIGLCFYGSKGILHLGWSDGSTFYPANDKKPVIHEDAKPHQPGGQNIPELWANFIECVRTRGKPICDIEIGHRSTSMALLGMIAYRTGRLIQWDGARERIVGAIRRQPGCFAGSIGRRL